VAIHASLLQGCLYIDPIWRPEVNLPPEIIRPEDFDGEPVEIDLGIVTGMTVVVTEPDGDDIDIVWLQPPPLLLYEETATAADGTYTSMILVLNREEPGLDGAVFACDVIDEAVPANVVSIPFRFRTVVP
jgi:hypothetical protein